MPARGGGESDEYGGQVTIPVLNRIEGLHPLIDKSVENVALQLLFNGLVFFDEALQPTPDLVESWTVSADGLEWDFSLKRNVRFHDGVPLTSRDVVYTLNEILNHPQFCVRSVIRHFTSISLRGLFHPSPLPWKYRSIATRFSRCRDRYNQPFRLE